MEIKIVGTGCAKCIELEKRVREAVNKLSLNATITKISKINEIAETGVLLTPGLIIDNVIKTTGKLPSVEELVNIIDLSR